MISPDGRHGARGSAPQSPVVAPVVVAAALLIIVAMAVRSQGDGDGTDAGSPLVGQLLFGMLTGAFVVCAVVAGVVWWIRLRQGRRPRPTVDAPEPPPWWVRPLATLVALAVLTIVAVFGGRGPYLAPQSPDETPPPQSAPTDDTGSTGDRRSIGEDPFAFVAGGLVVLAVAAGLAVAVLRRPTVAGDYGEDQADDDLDDESAQPVARALDASLADLSSEPDPRRTTETSAEFCRRVLVRLGAGRDAASRLTALFERARYSEHPIDDAMRAEAIDAVHQVRDAVAVGR
jgi:hypothetical protein